ncbi:jerky protein homolog-like [Aricia agestis]|uniref:jerky protein homolog-like n=1 Tax=Aricia agestis TaxID=91739 RepID=UPI001C20A85E|nr:jerky protein homolog-like [Aricia agestis]
MASQTQKRKHKALTIKEKCEILQRIDRSETMSKLAQEYGIGRATIFDIKKNRHKIEEFLSSTSECDVNKRKSLKKACHPEVEEALYTWFQQETNAHNPISGPMLTEKAKFFYNKITGKNDFIASSGWLDKFKTRYGIRLTCGKGSKSDVEPFKKKFLLKLQEMDLSPSQVYNVEEARLFWRVPCETDDSDAGECKAVQCLSKELVTFLPCANASGTHKLKMTVVGKSEKPLALKKIDLPLNYCVQKRGSITKELFKQWFFDCFVPEVKNFLKERYLPQKALLMLVNAPGRPSEEELTTEDKNITAMFLPSNCSSLIQPMEQRVIQFIKQDYKKKLMTTALSKNQAIEDTLNEVNMKDLFYLLCECWNEMPDTAIASSWNNLWPEIVFEYRPLQLVVDYDLIHKFAIRTQISSKILENWFQGRREEESLLHKLSDEEIMKQVLSTSDTVNEVEAEELVCSPLVPVDEAIKAFEVGLQWAEENEASYEELMLLRRLRDKALLSRLQNTESIKVEEPDPFEQY